MTAPEPDVESLGGGDWDVSSLFEPRQLRGRQVCWEAVRQGLAELGRPSTLLELRETIWRQYTEYVTRVGLGVVRRTEKFASLVENIVSTSVVAGRVVLARVGAEGEEEEFVWLERAEWPGVREREAWSEYRTVHQASIKHLQIFPLHLQSRPSGAPSRRSSGRASATAGSSARSSWSTSLWGRIRSSARNK